jgi:hypothetical protein
MDIKENISLIPAIYKGDGSVDISTTPIITCAGFTPLGVEDLDKIYLILWSLIWREMLYALTLCYSIPSATDYDFVICSEYQDAHVNS